MWLSLQYLLPRNLVLCRTRAKNHLQIRCNFNIEEKIPRKLQKKKPVHCKARHYYCFVFTSLAINWSFFGEKSQMICVEIQSPFIVGNNKVIYLMICVEIRSPSMLIFMKKISNDIHILILWIIGRLINLAIEIFQIYFWNRENPIVIRKSDCYSWEKLSNKKIEIYRFPFPINWVLARLTSCVGCTNAKKSLINRCQSEILIISIFIFMVFT